MFLSEFIIVARAKKGEQYEPSSLRGDLASVGKGCLVIPSLRDWETLWKQSKKNWKKDGRGIKSNAQFGWIISFTSAWKAAQNNETCAGATLFWGLIVRAKNILFIQRDKLRADRAKTHGMSGPWNRECMKTKRFQPSAIQWMFINCTEINVLSSC